MDIPVLIEPCEGRFRAKGFDLTAEGATRSEALKRLREVIEQRISAGAEITTLRVPEDEHPLAPFAGTLDPADPLVAQWKEAMTEWRRQKEAEEDLL